MQRVHSVFLCAKLNICAKTGRWKPNYCVTLLHLALTVPVYDESSSVRHVRRMFHPGRGLGGPRARRTNMHFTSSSTGGLSSSSSQSSTYTPSNREAMDPIAGETPGSAGALCRAFSPHWCQSSIRTKQGKSSIFITHSLRHILDSSGEFLSKFGRTFSLCQYLRRNFQQQNFFVKAH